MRNFSEYMGFQKVAACNPNLHDSKKNMRSNCFNNGLNNPKQDTLKLSEKHSSKNIGRMNPFTSLISSYILQLGDYGKKLNSSLSSWKVTSESQRHTPPVPEEVVKKLFPSDSELVQNILAAASRTDPCMRNTAMEQAGRIIGRPFTQLVDEKGRTALHYAAEQGNVSAVKTLIDAGLDTSIEANNGQTALKITRQKLKEYNPDKEYFIELPTNSRLRRLPRKNGSGKNLFGMVERQRAYTAIYELLSQAKIK